MRLLAPEELRLDRRNNAHLHRPPPRTPLDDERRRRIARLLLDWGHSITSARSANSSLHLWTPEPLVFVPEGGQARPREMALSRGGSQNTEDTEADEDDDEAADLDPERQRVAALIRKVRRFDDCTLSLEASEGDAHAHAKTLRRFRIKAARDAISERRNAMQRRSSSDTDYSNGGGGPAYV